MLKHRNTQETLAVLDRLDLDTDKPGEEQLAKRFGFEDDFYAGGQNKKVLIMASCSTCKRIIAFTKI